MTRWAWWLLAYASLALGIIGIVVPGLPTVPFVLLAAFAAVRGSERLRARLLADPRFGPVDPRLGARGRGVAPGEAPGDRDDVHLRGALVRHRAARMDGRHRHARHGRGRGVALAPPGTATLKEAAGTLRP